MTLITDKLNRPLHDLRISVIDKCNFRCHYCMPDKETKDHHFLNKTDWMGFDEIERLTRLFVRLGTKKIRLTGGEPLLRPNLKDLIGRLYNIKGIEDLALTTNGSLLSAEAASLKKAGLNRLTISLDTLDSRLFHAMSGQRGSLERTLDGIEKAISVGFKDIKINVVVQQGVNDASLMDMVDYCRGKNLILRFIEFMDVGNCNHWESALVVPSKTIIEHIRSKYPIEPLDPNYFGEVAGRYRYLDGNGEIGFVSSVTQPFCHTCTRARLSADGKLITCLFASSGEDLLTPLRAGEDDQGLLGRIASVWSNREDRYSERRFELINSQKTSKKVEMFQIGG